MQTNLRHLSASSTSRDRRLVSPGLAMALLCLTTASAPPTASADFTVDLGSGDLAGGETRFVEIEADAFMVGFEITFDYIPGADAEWASDMAFWVNDAAGSPSVQIGGYNVLFADQEGPLWGFDGAGSAAAGTYTDTQTLIHSGKGVWRFSIGNGWSGSKGATFDNVIVTVFTLDDCDSDGVPDSDEIAAGAADCNGNGVPDVCDIADGSSIDSDGNDVPDECEDCNLNGVVDSIDISAGTSLDCNSDLIPDECQLAGQDCNADGVLNECEIANGSPDCNGNGIPDACDIAAGSSADINFNGVPDECDDSFLGFAFESNIVQDGTDYYTVTDVFASFANASDTLLNLFNVQVWPSSGAGFVQNDLAGGHWSPSLCDPALVSIDSFVLIGGLPNSANTTFLDPTFGSGTQPVPPANAGWFNSNPPNLQGRVDPKQLRTWIGRFVHDGCDASVLLFFQGNATYNQGIGTGALFAWVGGNGSGPPFVFPLPECVDTDSDGVPDPFDNCQAVWNPGQEDCDGNGVGDVCDADADGDGVSDCVDNCVVVFNPDQEDCDGDGIGNLCETPPGCCPADLTNNGAVDGADLGLILGFWGPCSDSTCWIDLTGDGLIDGAELAVILSNWGPCQ